MYLFRFHSIILLSVSPEKPTCNYIYGTLPTSPVASLFFESTALSYTHYGGYSLTLQSLSECLLHTLVLCRPRSVRFRVLPISCLYSCHCKLVIVRGASGTLGDKWFLLPSGRMLTFFPFLGLRSRREPKLSALFLTINRASVPSLDPCSSCATGRAPAPSSRG